MVTLSGKSCLQFYYHMYGASMGTLKVALQDALIFEKSGNQGDAWKMQEIRLQGSGSKEVSTITETALSSRLLDPFMRIAALENVI